MDRGENPETRETVGRPAKTAVADGYEPRAWGQWNDKRGAPSGEDVSRMPPGTEYRTGPEIGKSVKKPWRRADFIRLFPSVAVVGIQHNERVQINGIIYTFFVNPDSGDMWAEEWPEGKRVDEVPANFLAVYNEAIRNKMTAHMAKQPSDRIRGLGTGVRRIGTGGLQEVETSLPEPQ